MKQEQEKSTARLSRGDMIRIAQLLGFAAALLLLWKYFDVAVGAVRGFFNVFAPFLLGGAFAFVINMPMRAIEKLLFGGKKTRASKRLKKLARPVSLALAVLFVLALVALFFGVLVPQLSDTIDTIAKSAQEFYPKAEAWVIKTFEDNPQIIETVNALEMDWKKLGDRAGEVLKNSITTVVSSGVTAVVNLFSGIFNTCIGLIFACYVLFQKEKLGNQANRLLHAIFRQRTADNICGVAQLAEATFSSFVRGQCLEAVILGMMFVVSMSIFGMPYPLLVGVLITFTALIPIFGGFIGCAISALMILMVNPWQALMFILLFLVLQQLEGNLIYPHVVGNSVGLPSIWVLVAVTVGGSLMGVLGMLIFIPLSSVAYALLRSWVTNREKRRTAAQTPAVPTVTAPVVEVPPTAEVAPATEAAATED